MWSKHNHTHLADSPAGALWHHGKHVGSQICPTSSTVCNLCGWGGGGRGKSRDQVGGCGLRDHAYLRASRVWSVMSGQLSSSKVCSSTPPHDPNSSCPIPASVIFSQWERTLSSDGMGDEGRGSHVVMVGGL